MWRFCRTNGLWNDYVLEEKSISDHGNPAAQTQALGENVPAPLTATRYKVNIHPAHPISLTTSYPPGSKLHSMDLQHAPLGEQEQIFTIYQLRGTEHSKRHKAASSTLHWPPYSVLWQLFMLLTLSFSFLIRIKNAADTITPIKRSSDWADDRIDSHASCILSRILNCARSTSSCSDHTKAPVLQSQQSPRTAFEMAMLPVCHKRKLSCLSSTVFYDPYFGSVSSTWKTHHNISWTS